MTADNCVDAVHVGWMFFTLFVGGLVGLGFGYTLCLLTGDRIVISKGGE